MKREVLQFLQNLQGFKHNDSQELIKQKVHEVDLIIEECESIQSDVVTEWQSNVIYDKQVKDISDTPRDIVHRKSFFGIGAMSILFSLFIGTTCGGLAWHHAGIRDLWALALGGLVTATIAMTMKVLLSFQKPAKALAIIEKSWVHWLEQLHWLSICIPALAMFLYIFGVITKLSDTFLYWGATIIILINGLYAGCGMVYFDCRNWSKELTNNYQEITIMLNQLRIARGELAAKLEDWPDEVS